MIRVVIVDDHALVRTGFKMILDETEDIEVVGEAADGAAALDLVRRTRPDVVLMDIRMPRLNGIEATRRIRSLAAPPPRRTVGGLWTPEPRQGTRAGFPGSRTGRA